MLEKITDPKEREKEPVFKFENGLLLTKTLFNKMIKKFIVRQTGEKRKMIFRDTPSGQEYRLL